MRIVLLSKLNFEFGERTLLCAIMKRNIRRKNQTSFKGCTDILLVTKVSQKHEFNPLRSITKDFAGYPVARHFKPPSPCNISHFTVSVFIQTNGSNKDKLHAKHCLNFKLGSIQPIGINIRFSVFNL